jgi:hypothetical protein
MNSPSVCGIATIESDHRSADAQIGTVPIRRSGEGGERRGAGGNPGLTRRAVDADVRETNRGAQPEDRENARSRGHFGQSEMELWRRCAVERDGRNMPSRIARLEARDGRVGYVGDRVISGSRERRQLGMPVLVRRGPVMVLWVIVFSVVVGVQRCDRRRHRDQGDDEEGCQRASHWRESTQRERTRSNHHRTEGLAAAAHYSDCRPRVAVRFSNVDGRS